MTDPLILSLSTLAPEDRKTVIDKAFGGQSDNVDGADRDAWRTPPELIAGAQRLFGVRFVLDLAADADNAVCGTFYDRFREPAGKADWGRDLATEACGEPKCAAWLNPPFSEWAQWAELVDEKRRGLIGDASIVAVCLTQHASRWWNRLRRMATTVAIITEGRIDYLPPPGVKATSNALGSTLFHIHRMQPVLQMTTYPTRAELYRAQLSLGER